MTEDRWPRTKVTAPYLQTPGVYWVIICDDKPYHTTCFSEREARGQEKLRGLEWVETIVVDTTMRTRRPYYEAQWTTRQQSCQYPGTCFLCARRYTPGSDIVVVRVPSEEREGWVHTQCAYESGAQSA